MSVLPNVQNGRRQPNVSQDDLDLLASHDLNADGRESDATIPLADRNDGDDLPDPNDGKQQEEEEEDNGERTADEEEDNLDDEDGSEPEDDDENAGGF